MLPKNPMLLLSVINMKLRDQYDSLDALCEDLDESKDEINEILHKEGYFYSSSLNHFKEDNND